MPSEHLPLPGAGGESYDTIAAAVLNDIADSNVPGFVIRQLPRAPDASQPVFILWLIGAGRFCLTVRAGRHVLLRDAWHLDTGASLQRITSPLAQAWDEAVLASRAIHRKLKRWASFTPAVYFPDTEPDAHIQRVAERSSVAPIWALDGFTRRLADAAAANSQLNPPSRRQASEEMSALINANAPATGPP